MENINRIELPATVDQVSSYTVHILPNDSSANPGKLAEVELHISGGPLGGLKLIGFAIWERRGGNGRNVTFPARQYSVNGERRSFALLRPAELPQDGANPQDRVRDLILEAFNEYERRASLDAIAAQIDAPEPQPTKAPRAPYTSKSKRGPNETVHYSGLGF